MLTFSQAQAQARSILDGINSGALSRPQAQLMLRGILGQVSAAPPPGKTAIFFSGRFRSIDPNNPKLSYNIGSMNVAESLVRDSRGAVTTLNQTDAARLLTSKGD